MIDTRWTVYYVSVHPEKEMFFSELSAAVAFCKQHNIDSKAIFQFKFHKPSDVGFFVELLNDLSPYKKIKNVKVEKIS